MDILSQIKEIAGNFNLKFKDEWFKFEWVSTRQEILSEYYFMCPDPIYNKYGKNQRDRIRNFNYFVNSKDFKKCLKRYGGQVMSEFGNLKKQISKITQNNLREELNGLIESLNKKRGNSKTLAVLTLPKNVKQKKWLLNHCLRHEWIHILLDKNKIRFQDINKKYWPYDEGINEYLSAFLEKGLSKLEKKRDNENYPMEKKYFIYAIKFRELLKHCKTPPERRSKILKFMESLS